MASDLLSSTWHAIRHSKTSTLVVCALAVFVDTFTYSLLIPILPSIEPDPLKTSLLFTSFALGLLLFTPLFGYLYDKTDRKKEIMCFGLFGLILATLLFPIASNTESDMKYAYLVIARIAQGASGGATWSIGLSLLAETYEKDALGGVMGWVSSFQTLGGILGPPLGGVLHEYVGPNAPFYFAAGVAGVDLLARLIVVPPLKSRHETEEEPGKRASLKEILSTPSILLILLASSFVAVIYNSIEPTLPYFLKDVFSLSEATTGLILIAIVIPNVIVSVLAGKISDKYGRKRTSAAGFMLASIVGLPWMPFAPNIPVEVVTLMLFGSTMAICMVPLMPELASNVDKLGGGAYGQAYALFNVAYSLGMLVGPVIGGWIVGQIGFRWVCITCSAVSAIACFMFIVMDIIERRNKREQDDEEEQLLPEDD